MEFKKVGEKDVAFLRSFLPEERILLGERIGEEYAHDEMTEYGCYAPELVVEALTAEEISKLFSYCNREHIAVTPRGAGTGLCGACVPLYGGIVLSTARMNHILELDAETLTAVAEPGVLLMDLAEAALGKGLLYPPDPGEKSATVGGNVMTNAGGMRAVRYGVTREYVKGMQAVLPNGEIVEFGGRVAKNSSGYSLKDLLIGSEGTLGVVTKLYLKLIPAPQKTVSLLVPFENIGACLRAVPAVLQGKTMPTTLEFMEREVILDAEEYLAKDFPDKEHNAYLLLSFSGDGKKELEGQYAQAAEICLDSGAIDVYISNTEDRQEGIWSARGAFLEAIKNSTTSMDECDVVVPSNRIEGFLSHVRALSESEGVRIRSFGHAGDGNLHVYVCRDALGEGEWEEKRSRIMDALYQKSIELGGQVSGEHGIGHAKKEYLEKSLGETQLTLMRGIKRVFDPNGILNPGKLF